MHKEIIVNSTPYEVRIAILEDKELVEHLIERAESKRMVGDIHKGVVTAVLPGIQAAFVDIGTEKAAFLHVSDLLETRDEIDEEPSDRRRGPRGNGRPPRLLPPIQDILQKGQELLVQVTKEPIATKGPRITTQISLPGRFAVIMPNVDHVGVSRKIEDRSERQRLKELVVELKPVDCALIVRTVGEGAERKALEHDVQHLVDLWKEIQAKAATVTAPAPVHQDVGLVIGLVRDVFNDDVDQVVLDDRAAYDQLTEYLKSFAPELRERVKLYTDPTPIFDKYGIEQELDKTLDRKVWLKKGGYILIEQTEALVAIDVNTGRFTGKKNQEETILKTNLLAAREVSRQLRLRDIGGIIVIDFIDMESEANKKKVLTDLRTWLKRDRAKTKAFQVSDLGLIEMSRQRVRPSLYHFMSEKCAYCEATGHILSLDSVSNRIERMVRRVSHYTRAREVRLQTSSQLAVFLREERYDRIKALMEATGVKLDLVDDARLHREEFRLISVQSGEDLMRRVSGPGLNGSSARPEENELRRRPVRSSTSSSTASVPGAAPRPASGPRSRGPSDGGGRGAGGDRSRAGSGRRNDRRPEWNGERREREPGSERPYVSERRDAGFERPREGGDRPAEREFVAGRRNELEGGRPSEREGASSGRRRERGGSGSGRRERGSAPERRWERSPSPAAERRPEPVESRPERREVVPERFGDLPSDLDHRPEPMPEPMLQAESAFEPSGGDSMASGADAPSGNGTGGRRRRRGSRGRGRRGGTGRTPGLEDSTRFVPRRIPDPTATPIQISTAPAAGPGEGPQAES